MEIYCGDGIDKKASRFLLAGSFFAVSKDLLDIQISFSGRSGKVGINALQLHAA